MKKFKYIILGAGPAGLTFANKLLEIGETSFIVLEKESRAGGLCRTEIIDGSPLDIGGGHFLDERNEKALEFIFKFMPEHEWKKFERISTIKLENNEINYPFESNIWQFPIQKQVNYLLSISKAGCSLGEKMPKKFVNWIAWKLGEQIAHDYMIPYNEKIWSVDLDRLGTYWLYKLPNVSLKETLLSCIERKPSGNLPAHANFFYPKNFGYEEVWRRMANKLGNKLISNFLVRFIDTENKIVNEKYCGEKIIVTIPWKSLKIKNKIPDRIVKNINSLEHVSIRTTYYSKKINTKSHWTYIPQKNIAEHRHLYRFNFIDGANGYWTETNEKRSLMIESNNNNNNNKYWINEFAYPLNTLDKPKAIKNILEYFSENQIWGLGRWGEWEHMNSDVVVIRSLELANNLLRN